MKFCLFCCDTTTFLTFRGEFIKSVQALGHEVVCIGNESEEKWNEVMAQNGLRYRCVPFSKTGINPLADIRHIITLYKTIKQERPDKIFIFMAKAISYGCPAARLAGIGDVYAMVAGLGSVFLGTTFKARMIRSLTSLLYWNAFRSCRRVIFQNGDDVRYLTSRRILKEEKIGIVNGSGVNLSKFTVEELPEEQSFLFVGRLLQDKGIREYLEAAKRIKEKHPRSRFMIVGFADSNPSSLSLKDIQPYVDNGIIEYYGRQADVRPYIKQARVFVLPSYFEGTPRSVLEAMSMGRPIVTTDAPGCRETTRDGDNGFLVPIRDADTLAERMLTLAEDFDLARRMGARSRDIAEEKYDVDKVNAAVHAIMGIE